MAAAPPSTERGVLVAVAGTLLFLAALLVIPAFLRPAPLLFVVVAFYLVPSVTIGWLIAVVVLALSRNWRAALMALSPILLVLAWSMSPRVMRAISDPLTEGAVRLEFAVHRSSYDDLVAQTPKGEAPRLIRVSQREVDDFRPHFEEIWFDEADQLGSADSSVRGARFDTSHPRPPEQTRPSSYAIRALGGHYYFIDVRNWMPE